MLLSNILYMANGKDTIHFQTLCIPLLRLRVPFKGSRTWNQVEPLVANSVPWNPLLPIPCPGTFGSWFRTLEPFVANSMPWNLWLVISYLGTLCCQFHALEPLVHNSIPLIIYKIRKQFIHICKIIYLRN